MSDDLHPLLARQLRRAQTPDGALDVPKLLALISTAYAENERQGVLADRAFSLASEELEIAAKRLAEERDASVAARRAAERANEAKTRFLANMSHELRTPLNAIIGYSELVMEDAQASGLRTYVDDCQRILAAARHLLSLIQEVLDVTRLEARRMELRSAACDLDALVEEVAHAAHVLAKRNRNMFRCDCGVLGLVEADSLKIRQCLLNLLGNACKFTKDGEIDLRVFRDGAEVVFEVRDTGIGIAEDRRQSLFEPFEQAHESFVEGAGLGLAITRRLCDLMGGRVGVTSVLGAGSTFTIRLPLPRVDVAATDEVGARMRVLDGSVEA